MGNNVNIKDIVGVLKKRLVLICFITVVATILSGLISYFVLTPIYEADTQILVNQSNKGTNSIEYSQLITNVQLVNTYSIIIKSPAILEKVISQYHLKQTPEQLSSEISVNSAQDSQVFSVSVQDKDPARAVKIANGITTVFQNEIKKIMNIDNVSVLSKAQETQYPKPVTPRPLMNMAIAAVVGFMLSIGLTFLLEHLDTSIKNEDDIQRVLELPLLGVITKIDIAELKEAESLKRTSHQLRGESFEV